MEFPSISMGICMEKILMEFHLKSMEIGILKEFLSLSMEIGLGSSWSMEIGLESSWQISQWNTQGIPFKINRNCLESILMEIFSKSMEICLESSWSIS